MKARSLAVLSALLLAGCGTTVSSVTASDEGDNGGLSVPGGTGATGPGGGLGVPGTGGSTGSTTGIGATATTGGTGVLPGTGSTGGTTSGTQGTGGEGLPPVGSGLQQGLGVTKDKVYIGVPYLTDGSAANAAIGAAGLTTGDTKADAQAVIDDVNAHGGVAGRKLVPVFVAESATSSDTKQHQDEVACSSMTEDHRVLAVAGTGVSSEMEDCLTKHGVIQVDANVILDPDDEVFREHPGYFEMDTLSQDRMMADEVKTLRRLDYFSGWDTTLGAPGPGRPKIGIISVDVPEWERPLTHVLLPALARLGYQVNPNDIRRIHNPDTYSEDSATVAQVENAVLRFHSDGVTHVIDLDPSGGLALFFGPTARSQNYYPRYGITTGSGAQAIHDQGGLTNKQLNGAVGLGWLPNLDLPLGKSKPYLTSSTERCLQVIKKRTGQTFTDVNAAGFALGTCDQIYLIADAINAAGKVINGDTVRAGIERMRSRFIPASLPASYFSPQQHDGVRYGYDMQWFESCSCIRYVGRHVVP